MSIIIRQVSDANVTAEERALMIQILIDSFQTYRPHVELWGSDPKVNNALMSCVVNHGLNKKEAWIAELDGRLVGVSLWSGPGREFMEGDEFERLFKPVIEMLPAESSDYLMNVIFPQQMAFYNEGVPNAELEWWFCEMLGVDPRYQGHGVGTALLEHKAAAVGGAPMGLSTQSKETLKFYEKLGYKVRADHPFTLLNGYVWHDHLLSCPGDATTVEAEKRKKAAAADAATASAGR